MSSITLGQSPNIHSQIRNDRMGRITPEEIFNVNVPAGAVQAIIYVNPSDTKNFRIVDVRERHTTPGVTPMLLRVHDKTQSVAIGTAVNGTSIYNIVSIPTTGANNTWQRATSLAGVAGAVTFPAVPAGRKLGAVPPGGTLIMDVPATLAGSVLEILGIYQ